MDTKTQLLGDFAGANDENPQVSPAPSETSALPELAASPEPAALAVALDADLPQADTEEAEPTSEGAGRGGGVGRQPGAEKNLGLALHKGRKKGSFDYTFAERRKAWRYMMEVGYILTVGEGDQKDVRQNRRMRSKANIPVLPGNPKIFVDSVIGWWHHAARDRWQEMEHDKECIAECGKDFFEKRSRYPRAWAKKLNRRLPGRPRFVDKYPELTSVLQEADSLHQEQRKRKKHCDSRGFHETCLSCLQLKNAELADQNLPQIKEPKFSRGWLNSMQKELGAETQATGSMEPKDVEAADNEAYWKGYRDKMRKVQDPLDFPLE